MGSTYGKNIKISVFGQSHGEAIGVIVDGIKAGNEIDMDMLDKFMSRRIPTDDEFSTKRKEKDKIEFLSGLVGVTTCEAPLMAMIRNEDVRSSDYDNIVDIPRPSHADYPAHIKHKGQNDKRGGGHYSARLTAPLCIVGGIAKQFLCRDGVNVYAHIQQIGSAKDDSFMNVNLSQLELEEICSSNFPVLNKEAKEKIKAEIHNASMDGDSVGGIIECMITGVPVGLGDGMFEGVENRISQAIFSIPAVKGIEFGNGFDCASLRGSENNDEYTIEDGKIRTSTNRNGGVIGGMSSGEAIIFRLALKPTPSISKMQNSISISKMTKEKLIIRGRHDACIVPRAVSIVEAVSAFVIYDMMMDC